MSRPAISTHAAPVPDCPRCAAPLARGRCEHVEADLCPTCSGLLLHRSGLASVLEVLAHAHYASVSTNASRMLMGVAL